MQVEKNFVERYTAWAESFTDAPPVFHRFVGYWVLSTLLGRRVWMHLGDEWLFPNLWMVVLAPSSFYRKSTALSIGLRVVEAVQPGLRLPAEWSEESLIAQMSKGGQAHGAMVAFEFRGLLATIQKDYNRGAQSLLTELYDCPNEFVRKKGVEEIKEFKIDRPYMTILGASTIEWLISSVQGGDIAGGFLARFLFVSSDRKDKVLAIQPEADDAERARVIALLKETLNIPVGSGKMAYTLEARAYYEAWYGRFFKATDTAPEQVRAFFPRLTAYAHKFAMLEAVQNGHFPTVTLDDCRRACMIADGFAAEIRRLGAESLGKSKFDDLKLRMVRAIEKNPGIQHSTLLRNLSISAKVFKDVRTTLEESGEIESRDGCYYVAETAGAIR